MENSSWEGNLESKKLLHLKDWKKRKSDKKRKAN
jgi:hypothetical protein